MSGFDIFAWVVLLVIIATVIFVLVWAYLRTVARPLDQHERNAARQRSAELDADIEAAMDGEQQP